MRSTVGRGFAVVAALAWTIGLMAAAVAEDLPPGTVIDTGKPSVRVIQQQLRRQGYAPGKINGRLDSRTRAAARSFQADCGLPADASAGGTTKDKLIRPGTCPSAGR